MLRLDDHHIDLGVFLGLGVLPFGLSFVALYGWGMSWPSESERRKVPAPVHAP